jgi:hypothetical protein
MTIVKNKNETRLVRTIVQFPSAGRFTPMNKMQQSYPHNSPPSNGTDKGIHGADRHFILTTLNDNERTEVQKHTIMNIKQ